MMIRRQDGIASLVSVTLTSFLILIITVAITGLMIGELRQAEDAESSVRAYYAAQGGAEDAISYIKRKLTSAPPANLFSLNQGCGGDNVTAGGNNDTAIASYLTCRTISAYSTDIQSVLGSPPKSLTAQFDLTNGVSRQDYNVDHFTVEWDSDSAKSGFFSSQPASPLKDTSANWPDNPPTLQMTITNYFPNQPARVDQATTKTLLLVPQCYVAVVGQCQQSVATINYATSNGIIGVRCSSSSASPDYRCRADITNVASSGYKTVLNLRTRFGDMKYHIYGMADSSGTAVQIPLKNAQVDVTAKSGDSFRRVTLEVPIRSGAYAGINALYGDSNICKNFLLFEDSSSGYSQVQPGVCPLDNTGN